MGRRAAEYASMLSGASKVFAAAGPQFDALISEIARTTTDYLGDTCTIRIRGADGLLLESPVVFSKLPDAEPPQTGSAMMLATLRTRDQVFGTISVSSSDADATYDNEDLAFFGDLVDRAALAIENADLIRRLASADEKLHMAMEAGRLGVFEWNVITGSVFWSPTLEEAHGLPRGSFAGTFEAFQRDIHPDDRASVIATIERVVRERCHHYLEYRIIRPDGETRWLEANARLHCDVDGTPLRLLGICTDVTERKHTESQLAQSLASLTEAGRRKDQFLAMLAHELRNPLTPMALAVSMLETKDTTTELESRAYEILSRQMKHMTRLVDDLLDVSRVARGKIDLSRETLDLCKIIGEVVRDHEAVARTRGIAFDVLLPAEPYWVTGDRTRLAQIVGNVISNSLKFSPAETRVLVGLETHAASCVVTVRDQGCGIAADLLPTIFEPFTQAETEIDRSHGGLGLGLAVVRLLVELHGGKVSAHSAGAGKGTELRIWLPRGTAPHVVAPAAISAAAGTLRILVVEDNPDLLEMLSHVLRSDGHRVETTSTGVGASRLAADFRPDVVLCDLGLPDRNGFDVAAELRNVPEIENIALIALSGYGNEDDKRRSRQAGFDVHLTKPVDVRALRSLLGGLGSVMRRSVGNAASS